MRSTVAISLGVLTALQLTFAHADSLNNIRASSQFERDRNPALYHPLNLLDDDPATMWCEGADGLGEGESVRLFFKTKQRIDRVVVAPALQTGRLVTVVEIDDGTNTVRVDLRSHTFDQQLSRPLEGTTYSVNIRQVGGPNPDAKISNEVACLGDVLLYYKNRLFGGKISADRLRYDPLRDRVLGPWNGEPFGAPEKFLSFSLDGTWEWSYKPLMGGENQRVFGEYRFRGAHLLMRRGESGRWKDVGFAFRHVKIDPDAQGAPKGDYDAFHLNKELGPLLAGDYDNAVF